MKWIKTIREKLYLAKQWLFSIFAYPPLRWRGSDYDQYWHHRKLTARTPLNSFQKKRADLALKYIKEGSSMLDIGAGNGMVLLHINSSRKLVKMIGADISKDALEMMKENGIQTIEVDISNIEHANIPPVDYILMFELIEHIPNSEELLNWAVSSAAKGVLFSVPNTGFLFDRLRLLFGRFPLQWRLKPSEHIRFWTRTDMKWWLKEMGYRSYELHTYKGVTFLNKIFPGLFSEGLFVYIPKHND